MKITLRAKLFLWMGAACALLSSCAATPAAPPNSAAKPVAASRDGEAKEVKLQDDGDKVTLDNGIISAVVVKNGARIASLKFKNNEMLNPARGVYFSMDGGASFRSPDNCVYAVKSKSVDMVDISCKQVWKDQPQAFDIDVHYVLRRGDSGVYAYVILDHPESYPATTYGEWRMVWRTPVENEDWIFVDQKRHWQMPNPEDYKTAEKTTIGEIVKLTQGPRVGQYDCKYDFNASYYDIGCWGHAYEQKNVGAWIALGGYDYFNDGPTKQDLTAASEINHLHFGMNHYNSSSPQIAAGEKWSKIYGPYLLYCNANEGGVEALWKDAKARVEKEKAAWPYAWLTGEPNYPPASERGSVSGRLLLKDPLKPRLSAAGAWVGLAQPDAGGNWQFESKRYQYWTRADAAGRFRIPNVRPGTYTLYAFTSGVVGEYSQPNVTVSAGKSTPVGDLIWDVPRKGTKLAWEIGVPDRTAQEFRHGDDYFHGLVWQNFSKEFSNPLEYTIGKSNPATDWNYAQSRYGNEPGAPWKWRIHFQLDGAPPTGQATLTLAIASADRARLDIYVNDESKPLATVTPSVQGGNALLREGIHAKYCVEQVVIPANTLKSGDNTITLVQSNVRSPGYHVMYDYLSLELP
jgi:rhamnogalacturonan endolyase